MSHITLATQGLQAVDQRDWDKAVTLLSKALQGSASPAWLIARSKALVGLKRYEEALDDADLAFHTAYDRSNRKLIMEAQYRRAVAYYRLKQYANADCCSIYAMRLCKDFPAVEKEDPKNQYLDGKGFWTETYEKAKKESQEDPFNQRDKSGVTPQTLPKQESAHVSDWRRASTMRLSCLGAMEKLAADDPARKVTVSMKPERKELAAVKSEGDTKPADAPSAPANAAPKPAVPSDTPLQVQDFQSNTFITVSIFSKGVNRDELEVEMLEDSVRLNPLNYPSGDAKEFKLQLFSQIDPSKSALTVTPRKVELRLAKKTPGKWARLTKDDSSDSNAGSDIKKSEAPKAAEKQPAQPASATPETTSTTSEPNKDSTAKPAGPAYPTSSRSGPKNWDKIAKDDDEGEAGVNDFFKKLYSDATDEQKRAMMKSFTESNGTTLSTDWGDVGKRTVETHPPEGVEAKKW